MEENVSGCFFLKTVYIPFIHSRHIAKDRSLGVGRDIKLDIKDTNKARGRISVIETPSDCLSCR